MRDRVSDADVAVPVIDIAPFVPGDAVARGAVVAAVKRACEQVGFFVITGHEVPTLLAAADHITWCTSGTTYELGAPAAAMQNEVFAREYLGPSARGA